MKKLLHGLRPALAVMSLATATAALAAPAIPSEVKFTQPDGTTVRGRVHGDEFFGYRTTDDGYVMVENAQGYYEYANPDSARITPSGHRVQTEGLRSSDNYKARLTPGLNAAQSAYAQSQYAANKAARDAALKGTKPASTLPAGTEGNMRAANHSGSLKFLVIMVQYTDKSFTYSQQDFYNLLNQNNFNGVGSTADFYKNSSWNQFQPTFDVWGPVTVDMTAHEAKLDTPTMIYKACQLVDQMGADFTQYDTDGDGVVDNVYCFFCGYDQAQGGSEYDCIWSHASGIGYKGLYLDGKLISGYGCSSELKWASGADRVNIGTFTHEFGHVIGLPDMYRTSGDTGHTPGSWDTMAGGCYLNDSQSPPLFSAYERQMLGWCTIPTIPTGQVTVPDLQGSKDLPGYKIPTKTSGEYYIVEYRVKTQYQNYGLPNNGMLIWHVDKSGDYESNWNNNGPNNVGGHPCYDVFECNNTDTYASVAAGDAEFSASVMWPFGGRNGVNLYAWSGDACGALSGITDYSTYAVMNCGDTYSCTSVDYPVATFFENINLDGTAIGLPEGSFTTSQMADYCLPDNWISSFTLLPGYKLTIYTDDNFGGSSATYTAGSDWVGTDWNDVVSSIKIEPNGVSGKGGVWKIKNRNSGLYWDCNGNSTAENTTVVQWTDEGEEAYQQWQLEEYATGVYHIRPASNTDTKCEVYYGKGDNNTGLLMYPQATEYLNSQFILYQIEDGYYQLIARHCGKPLELAGSSAEAGTQITIYDNNGSECQQWTLERNVAGGCHVATFYADCNYSGTTVGLPEGEYTTWQLKLYGIDDNNLSSLKMLPGYKVTVYDDDNLGGTSYSYTSEVSCLTGDSFNDKTSSIKIEPVGTSGLGGKYKIKGHNSGLYWNIRDYSRSTGALLEQKNGSLLASQDFRLEETETAGVYFIRNLNSGLLVDVEGGNNACDNRTPVSQYTLVDGNRNQQFIAISKGEGEYQFAARNCGKVIEVPDNKTGDGDQLMTWDNNNQYCSWWKLEAIGSGYEADLTDNGGLVRVSHAAIKTDENETKLIDNSADTKYCANLTAGETVWMRYASTQSARITGYTITSGNDAQGRDPKAWTLQGSNDNENWTDLDSRSDESFYERGQVKGFPVSASADYGIFRLLVTELYDNTSVVFQVSELQLFGEPSGAFDPTTGISAATAAAAGLYPNPASDRVTVSGTSLGQRIEIMDLSGRKLQERIADDGATTLDISALENGQYIVRAGSSVWRLVK